MQTTYNLRHGVALAGMRADSGFGNTISAAASADVPAGVFVVRTGTYSQFIQGESVKVPASSSKAADVLGISLYLATKADTSTFRRTETVPVLQQGRAWVRATNTAVIDNAAGVYVSTAAGKEGWLTKSDEAGALRLFGVRVISIEEGLALVDANLPATVPDPFPETPPAG